MVVGEEGTMQRVFRVVDTNELELAGPKATAAFTRSVRRYGVVTPVLVAEMVDADGVIALTVVDGNRRIRAAKAERLPKVPAVVLKATTEQERARLTLMCNYMRSMNFHTESAAILSLASDVDAAAGAAKAVGLGPFKIQQLYRKITAMPEPVRRAMYEHRIPITAATWVGSWPEGLRREVVELLGRRRYLNTTMIKDLRASYAERHPEEFDTGGPAVGVAAIDPWIEADGIAVELPASPGLPESVPDASVAPARPAGGYVRTIAGQSAPLATNGLEVEPAWLDGDLQQVASTRAQPVAERPLQDARRTGQAWPPHEDRTDSIPAPAISAENGLWSGGTRVDVVVSAADRTHRTAAAATPDSRPVAFADPAAPGPTLASVQPTAHGAGAPVVVERSLPVASEKVDDRTERMVAFVVRLDATMRELAREGHALGIGRDRAVGRGREITGATTRPRIRHSMVPRFAPGILALPIVNRRRRRHWRLRGGLPRQLGAPPKPELSAAKYRRYAAVGAARSSLRRDHRSPFTPGATAPRSTTTACSRGSCSRSAGSCAASRASRTPTC
jgi:ParB/RepB/Spo0J family partition protein